MDKYECPICHGHGHHESTSMDVGGHLSVEYDDCDRCNGTGFVSALDEAPDA